MRFQLLTGNGELIAIVMFYMGIRLRLNYFLAATTLM